MTSRIGGKRLVLPKYLLAAIMSGMSTSDINSLWQAAKKDYEEAGVNFNEIDEDIVGMTYAPPQVLPGYVPEEGDYIRGYEMADGTVVREVSKDLGAHWFRVAPFESDPFEQKMPPHGPVKWTGKEEPKNIRRDLGDTWSGDPSPASDGPPRFHIENDPSPMPHPNISMRTDDIWRLLFQKYRLLDANMILKRRDEIVELFNRMINVGQTGKIPDYVLDNFLVYQSNKDAGLRPVRDQPQA